MSKTITIIKLLNKIANGEEVPENIKYHNRNLKETDIMLCCKENIIDKLDCESIYLNDVVEIIEEQEEIDIQELEKIKEMEVFLSVDTRQTLEENLKKIDKHEVNFFFKINEIIRKQNKIVQYLEQLDKNIKEKQ